MATEGSNSAKPTSQTPWDAITAPVDVITVPGAATALPHTATPAESVTVSLVPGPVLPAQLAMFEPPAKTTPAQTTETAAPADMPPLAMPAGEPAIAKADSLAVRPTDIATPQPAPMPRTVPPPAPEAVALQYASAMPANPRPNVRSGGWSIPLLCMGIGILACCLIVPQADTNRRLAYQRERLKQDLAQIDRQIEVNKDFLARLGTDPTLAERLAHRQMKVIRPGTAVLDVKGEPLPEMSPFIISAVQPPPPMPPYRPVAGFIGELFRQPRLHLYLTGGGLMLVAAGLILGYSPKTS